jgi:hypothetical protein
MWPELVRGAIIAVVAFFFGVQWTMRRWRRAVLDQAETRRATLAAFRTIRPVCGKPRTWAEGGEGCILDPRHDGPCRGSTWGSSTSTTANAPPVTAADARVLKAMADVELVWLAEAAQYDGPLAPPARAELARRGCDV